jgi:hypothetical protein
MKIGRCHPGQECTENQRIGRTGRCAGDAASTTRNTMRDYQRTFTLSKTWTGKRLKRR